MKSVREIISDQDSQGTGRLGPFDGPVSRFGSPAKRRGVSNASDSQTTRTVQMFSIHRYPIVTRSSPWPSMSRAARCVFNAEPSDAVSDSGYVQMNAPEI
jgi:hypothetical protein